MRKYISSLVLAICFILPVNVVQGYSGEEWLCAGKPWTTAYYVLQGEEAGPTIVIVGSTHGDEKAGFTTAQELLHYRPDCGRLIVIPEANRRAVYLGLREVAGEGNLNRAYPGKEDGLPMEQLAFAMMQLFREVQPDLVLDLHESQNFYRTDQNYVGQTLIAGAGEKSIWLGMLTIERLNAGIAEEMEQFTLLHRPVQGSTAWAVGELLDIPAFTVETCEKLALSKRKEYQHQVIKYILHEFGVTLVCN